MNTCPICGDPLTDPADCPGRAHLGEVSDA